MSTEAPEWSTALRALALLAVDPHGLKGITVRAAAGPVRQAFEGALSRLPGPVHRIHPGLSESRLFGGLDVVASLAEGRVVRSPGLADEPCTLLLTMAERTLPETAARLGHLLDADLGHGLAMFDESAGDEPPAPEKLRERLAFHVTLDGVRHDEAALLLPAPLDLDAARARLPGVKLRADDPDRLTALAAAFGIGSLRAPLLALRAARAMAALAGRDTTTDDDIREAAELVYPARATLLPEAPEPEDREAPSPSEAGDRRGDTGEDGRIPDDTIVAAIAARLPPGMLRTLDADEARGARTSGSGAGARHKGNRRGRPLPARRGRSGSGARIDIIATLRAAAPWQTLRRAHRPGTDRLIILPSDIRLRRYEDRSDRLLIFAVDASGSAAMARLGEAKGAVELLLGQAYARRDQVALIAFRGSDAALVLPPTRSLVQAKRRLAALPGGGGTPLAAGLREAFALAGRSSSQGLSPALALLTDGRANVALDGTGDRTRAREESRQVSRVIAASGMPGLVIDTSQRGTPETGDLAAALGARHIRLPHADGRKISRAITAALAV